jgi:DNA-binding NtrC family response regulator
MVEDVIIVLDEQQSAKAKAALDLEKNLNWRQFQSSRVTPDKHLAKVLAERQPRLVVTDYLLGEFGTAIELLENNHLANQSILVWTDEPGISTAVDAMKLGAVDYIDLNGSRSLEKVIKSIESVLNSEEKQPVKKKTKNKALQQVTLGQSSSFKETLASAEAALNQSSKTVVVYGPRGSGRSHIARHIHNSLPEKNILLEYNLDEWVKPLNDLLPTNHTTEVSKNPIGGLTLILDHCEFDSAGIISWLQNQDKNNLESNRIILGTTCFKTAKALEKICETKNVNIDSLEHRSSDFYPLVKHILSEAKPHVTFNGLEFTQALIQELIKLPWEGNIKELKSVVIESTATPVNRLKALAEEDSFKPLENLKNSENYLLAGILFNKRKWINSWAQMEALALRK